MRRTLLLLLPVLALAACESAPPKAVMQRPSFPGVARGIDLPTDARDVVQELHGSHLDFVARYYRDPASRWPTLSPQEARSVSASGIKLVTVFESHSHKPEYFNYETGYADGVNAYRQARQVGQPAGSAIYFAVDFNAQAYDLYGGVDRYFRGVYNAFVASGGAHAPEYRIGVYGSGAVCGYLKRARLAQYTWLSNSTAWSGYSGFSEWNIRQGPRSPSLSFSQDSNEARGEYGGFRVDSEYSSL